MVRCVSFTNCRQGCAVTSTSPKGAGQVRPSSPCDGVPGRPHLECEVGLGRVIASGCAWGSAPTPQMNGHNQARV